MEYYAALDMQAAIRRYAEKVRRTHGVELQIRVGLSSGEVVVRTIRSDLRMDYTGPLFILLFWLPTKSSGVILKSLNFGFRKM